MKCTINLIVTSFRYPLWAFSPPFGPIQKNMKIVAPGGVSNLTSAAWGLMVWGEHKTSHSEKSTSKAGGKRRFGKMAETGAVRKGGLLRGKVSQGRPHPLSIALRSKGQTLNQQKIELSVDLSVFFFLAERWHDVGHNVMNGLARR